MNTGFIVLGHGSKVSETVDILKDITDSLRKRLRLDAIHYAALQFNEPGLPEVINMLVEAGTNDIVVLPLFLTDGNHVREDIPGIINEECAKHPSVIIKLACHIGADMRITDILVDRIIGMIGGTPSSNGVMITKPSEIEAESFRIIETSTNLRGYCKAEKTVIKRIIHASGDLSLIDAIDISEDAIDAGITAIKDSRPIITDVRMVATGISDRISVIHDNNVICKVDDSTVDSEAKRRGKTRSAVAMRSLAEHIDGAIVAIGNAPTALFELLDIVKEGVAKPALVIGTPVGFVGAAESKEALMNSGLEYITVRGTRGGSAMAAAAVNALLKLACGGDCE